MKSNVRTNFLVGAVAAVAIVAVGNAGRLFHLVGSAFASQPLHAGEYVRVTNQTPMLQVRKDTVIGLDPVIMPQRQRCQLASSAYVEIRAIQDSIALVEIAGWNDSRPGFCRIGSMARIPLANLHRDERRIGPI